jgi:hypothetical protein
MESFALLGAGTASQPVRARLGLSLAEDAWVVE